MNGRTKVFREPCNVNILGCSSGRPGTAWIVSCVVLDWDCRDTKIHSNNATQTLACRSLLGAPSTYMLSTSGSPDDVDMDFVDKKCRHMKLHSRYVMELCLATLAARPAPFISYIKML